ncbi:glycosyltransferase family 1 protein [Candidatus Parcubacteria bacterium]|nr:MAG: glycosyltransferase family 1 protein [Candidatus Parcubacteria bacterium]
MSFNQKGEKKRILIVSTAYLPLIGGAELAVREITDRLGDNYDFSLICARLDSKLPSKERIGSVAIERVGFGSSFDKIILPFAVFLKAFREKRPDVLWVIMAVQGAFGALFFKIVRPKTKMLLTLQEGDPEELILKKIGIFYPLWRQIFRRADYIQVISRYLKNFAIRHGAVTTIEVIPNGVDFQKIKNTSVFKKFKAKKNEALIISTSRLAYKNGMDTLIEAMGILVADGHRDLRLAIAGSGPDESKLRDLAKRLKIESFVDFLGLIEPDDVASFLKAGDVFVRPSRAEGLGSSFLEAMAVGLPVIGTRVGGIPDFLEDQKTGLFCKVDDPKDLASKIKLLLSNKKLYENIALGGKNLVDSNYDWSNIAMRMKKIFDSMT